MTEEQKKGIELGHELRTARELSLIRMLGYPLYTVVRSISTFGDDRIALPKQLT